MGDANLLYLFRKCCLFLKTGDRLNHGCWLQICGKPVYDVIHCDNPPIKAEQSQEKSKPQHSYISKSNLMYSKPSTCCGRNPNANVGQVRFSIYGQSKVHNYNNFWLTNLFSNDYRRKGTENRN